MRAIILAGGSGTRLRPLTCDKPKPMIRACGRPVIEYSFDLLRQAGIGHATVTLGYLAERISEHYGDAFEDLSLSYTIEETPLGTAGAVRLACEDHTGSEVLVLSGDAVCDFDLARFIGEFQRTGADVLLAVKRVEDPREYGLVICNETGRVTGFVEKPSFSQAVSDLANTGIYMLSERALNLIPEGRTYDFAKDLFPLMLELGMPIYAVREEGYWCDIGDIASYMRCQDDLLSGRTRCHFVRGEAPVGDYIATGPVFYGKEVQIGAGCRIEGPCILDDYTVIEGGAVLQRSMLLPGAHIGRSAHIKGAIVDAHAAVGSGAMLFEGSVAGEGSRVSPRAVLHDSVKIWPHKTVSCGSKVTHNIKQDHIFSVVFDEHGISGEIGVNLTPELCIKIGAAIRTAAGKLLPVAHAGTPACQTICDALSVGIRSGGCDVLSLGAVPITVLGYSIGRLDSDIGVYVEEGHIQLVSEACLRVSRDVERRIEGALLRDEYLRVESAHYGKWLDSPIWRELYLDWLLREAGDLWNVEASIVVADSVAKDLVADFAVASHLRDGVAKFYIDLEHDHLTLKTERHTLSRSQTMMLAMLSDLWRGSVVAIPTWMPPACEAWAEASGGRVVRYAVTPADGRDQFARGLAVTQAYQHDPIFAAASILRLVRESGRSIDELASELPQFSETQREIKVSVNPAWIVSKLGGKRLPEGILLDLEQGSAILQPNKRGDALKLFMQASSVETADELCGQLLERIDEQMSDATV